MLSNYSINNTFVIIYRFQILTQNYLILNTRSESEKFRVFYFEFKRSERFFYFLIRVGIFLRENLNGKLLSLLENNLKILKKLHISFILQNYNRLIFYVVIVKLN